LNVQIVACEIYREKNGLALSSRNERLSEQQRQEAPLIYQTLLRCKEMIKNADVATVKDMVKNEVNKSVNMELEYFEIADVEILSPAERMSEGKKYRAFISVYADKVRLIDNIALN
jgi:pantoate--beta-alanine ligase